jgi:hypothetical protein
MTRKRDPYRHGEIGRTSRDGHGVRAIGQRQPAFRQTAHGAAQRIGVTGTYNRHCGNVGCGHHASAIAHRTGNAIRCNPTVIAYVSEKGIRIGSVNADALAGTCTVRSRWPAPAPWWSGRSQTAGAVGHTARHAWWRALHHYSVRGSGRDSRHERGGARILIHRSCSPLFASTNPAAVRPLTVPPSAYVTLGSLPADALEPESPQALSAIALAAMSDTER